MTRRAILLLLLAAAGSSCLTPSLPVPPPEPEAMAFHLDTAAGTATYRSDPQPPWANAIVFIWDDRTGEGVITTADADGAVAETAPFPAADGDKVFVEFRGEDQVSAVCLILHDGPSSSSNLCP